MTTLIPSEVGRLVLGYLEGNGCECASKHLLKELSVLSEVGELRKRGRKVSLRIGNRTLEDILTDYTDARDLVEETIHEYPSTFNKVSSKDSLHQQVMMIITIIIDNKNAILQNHSMGTMTSSLQNVKQRRLLKHFHDNITPKRNNILLKVNATNSVNLPGSSYHEPIRVEVPADVCVSPSPCIQGDNEETYAPSSPLNTPPPATLPQSEERQPHSVDGDSTSLSLTGTDFYITPQKRKGGLVKRRSQENQGTKTTLLENEANLEKILKNLYENTALHEKIAENINRGLSSQSRSDIADRNGESSNIAVNSDLHDLKFKDENISSAKADPVSVSRVRSGGSDDSGEAAFMRELDLDQMVVSGIISETTADPAFENLIEEVFGSNSSSQLTPSKIPGASHLPQDTAPPPSRPLSTPVPPAPVPTHQVHGTESSVATILSFMPNSLPTGNSTPSTGPASDEHHLNSHSALLSSTPHMPSLVDSPSSSAPAAPHSSSSAVMCGSFDSFYHSPILADPPQSPQDSLLPCNANSPKAESTKTDEESKTPVFEGRKTRSATRLSLSAGDMKDTKTTGSAKQKHSKQKEPSRVSTRKSKEKAAENDDTSESISDDTSCHSTKSPSDSSKSSLSESRKKCKRKVSKLSNKSESKEDEGSSLGDQLLQEFVDFQSNRPDKASELIEESTELQEELPPSIISPAEDVTAIGGSPCAESVKSSPSHDIRTAVAAQSPTHRNDNLLSTDDTGDVAVCYDRDKSPKNEAGQLHLSSDSDAVDGSACLVTPHLQSKPATDDSALDIDSGGGTQGIASPHKAMPSEKLPTVDFSGENISTAQSEPNFVVSSELVPVAPPKCFPIKSSTVPGISSFSPFRSPNYTLTEMTPLDPYSENVLNMNQMVADNIVESAASVGSNNLAASLLQSQVLTASTSSVVWNAPPTYKVAGSHGHTEETRVLQGRPITPAEAEVLQQDEECMTVVLPPVPVEQFLEGQMIMVACGLGNEGEGQQKKNVLQLPLGGQKGSGPSLANLKGPKMPRSPNIVRKRNRLYTDQYVRHGGCDGG